MLEAANKVDAGLIVLGAWGQSRIANPHGDPNMALEPGTYARFDTTEGEFLVRLFDKEPPVAPSNQGATNQLLFDPLGRMYRFGFRMNF